MEPERPTIGAIIETSLYAQDLVAVRRFYADVLGLEPFADVEGRHLFFRCGAGVLLIFNPQATRLAQGDVPAHGAEGPGHVAFAASAESLPAWRRRLEAAACPIEAEVDWPGGGRSLYFRDPAGNSLELTTAATWNLPSSVEKP